MSLPQDENCPDHGDLHPAGADATRMEERRCPPADYQGYDQDLLGALDPLG